MSLRHRNATGSTNRFVVTLVVAAAVLFFGIQLVPLLDGGRRGADVMPSIEVEDVPIQSVVPAEDDPTVIVVRVGRCDGEPYVSELEETSTEVRLRVVAQVEVDVNACPPTVRVQLQQPLGDRAVVDLSTSRRVE